MLNADKKALHLPFSCCYTLKSKTDDQDTRKASYCSQFHIKVFRLLQCMINQRMTNTKNPGLRVLTRNITTENHPLVPS